MVLMCRFDRLALVAISQLAWHALHSTPMTTANTPDYSAQAEAELPAVGILTMLQLGLFQMGLGVMSLLTLGVLNRLMIAELKVPALLVGLTIAMHQFVSPARLWFGQMSDGKPLFGYHRTGYVWLGTAAFTTVAFLALQAIWRLNISLETVGWTAPTFAWVGA